MSSAQHKICSAKTGLVPHMYLLLHNYFFGTVKDRSGQNSSGKAHNHQIKENLF
jgi:hypothetical protein